MKREHVDPVLIQGDSILGDTHWEHPSWAVVQVGRVSGLADLFGSALQHQHYIKLSIGRAQKIVSDNGEERAFGGLRGEIVEILLSEAQWAQLLSSMNMGQGVPCTLNYLDKKKVPECPPSRLSAQFHEAVQEDVKKLALQLQELQQVMSERFSDKRALTKDEKNELLGRANSAIRTLTDKLPFIQQMFQEKLEEQVAGAKIEIDSFLAFKAQLLGFQEITDKVASLGAGFDKALPEGEKK